MVTKLADENKYTLRYLCAAPLGKEEAAEERAPKRQKPEEEEGEEGGEDEEDDGAEKPAGWGTQGDDWSESE